MLHRVFRQYRDLSDLRRADQENSTSLCLPARFLQVGSSASQLFEDFKSLWQKEITCIQLYKIIYS